MTVIETIYLVAATLWILVVVAALAIGGRYLLKLRARRRRVTRLIDSVRLSVERVADPYRVIAGGCAAFLQQRVGGSGPARRPVLSSARGRR
ncbi:hypothetical protein KIH27_13970 [Mycobacterium sp. M1]|uniref:Uncharacterized protein n=1 Tax=Mycolicibacter acidiphilus TaxID=2835306 RepID=A0ABS5RMI9_9MYCO|nr:hypothetical protein [Mycolicibacter acidiphilus]MBS9534696.1 hypothetical protein [Mycolicibacter acidiphilus]